MPGAEQRDMYVRGSTSGHASVGGYNAYDGKGLGTTNTYIDASGRVVSVDTIQNVGTRTFYRRSDQWIDARYTAQHVYNIRQFSDAHFQLLDADPELKKYSTLGEVTVVINGNAIQIGAKGEEKLSPEQLKTILGHS